MAEKSNPQVSVQVFPVVTWTYWHFKLASPTALVAALGAPVVANGTPL